VWVCSLHPRHDLLVRRGCRRGSVTVWQLLQESALNDSQDLVPFDRLTTLVLARRKMVHRLEKVYVFERLTLARLKREHQNRVLRVADRHGETLQERKGFIPQRRFLNLDPACTD
jgi:hypothetical protein